MTQLSNSNINAVADLKPGYTLGAADVALLQGMARRLLAAEEQEPVAWEVKGILCHTLDEANGYVGQPEPLYAGPQPVAVPDERILVSWYPDCGYEPEQAEGFNIGWNACRAAMLNAERVRLAYRLPHWIPCSERMPEVHEPIYIFHPDYGVDQGVWYDDQEKSFFWDSDETRCRATQTVSHWMAMPALPAAPQEPAK